MEKLDNKLVDMRDMYDDWRRRQQRQGEDNIDEVSIYIITSRLSKRYCTLNELVSRLVK